MRRDRETKAPRLTAYELAAHGVPHTVIADNVGGHLMQRGRVDLVLVGSDRTTANGDVCNKIGTYLKALAAWDNEVPFYAALPVSTIDWSLEDGADIPIEERAATELSHIRGRTASGAIETVRVVPEASPRCQLCVRRDSGAIGHRAHHRARGLLRDQCRSQNPVSRGADGGMSGPQAMKGCRQAIIAGCRELARRGLTPGTSGNVSVRRDARGFFVSPTGMAYDVLETGDVPLVSFDGR